MPPEYSIHLCSPDGTRIDTLTRWDRLAYQMVRNTFGELTLVLRGDYDPRMLRKDGRIEVYRNKQLAMDQSWMIRGIQRQTDENGRRKVVVRALSGLYLLSSRVVAYDIGTAGGSKTDHPDDMIRAIVRENLGSSATDTDRSLATHLTVEADRDSVTPTLSKELGWMPVLQVCQEIANFATQQGTHLSFDTLYDPDAKTYTFRVFEDQRGTDHTEDSGSPVIFSFNRGNIVSDTLDTDWRNEATYVYAGGSGLGGEMVGPAEDEDADGINSSPFGRREAFTRVGQISDLSTLSDAAFMLLRERQAVQRYDAEIRSNDLTTYGIHFDYGDLVTVHAYEMSMDAHLERLNVTVENERDVGETVSGRLTVVGAL